MNIDVAGGGLASVCWKRHQPHIKSHTQEAAWATYPQGSRRRLGPKEAGCSFTHKKIPNVSWSWQGIREPGVQKLKKRPGHLAPFRDGEGPEDSGCVHPTMKRERETTDKDFEQRSNQISKPCVTGLGTPFSGVSSSIPDGGLALQATKTSTCFVLLF